MLSFDSAFRKTKNLLSPVPTGLTHLNRNSECINLQQQQKNKHEIEPITSQNHHHHHHHHPDHHQQQQPHHHLTCSTHDNNHSFWFASSSTKRKTCERALEAYVSFVLTVPGAFGAVWAIFASTDAVLGLFSDNKYRILTHKPVMLLAVFVASMTAIMACLKHVRFVLAPVHDNNSFLKTAKTMLKWPRDSALPTSQSSMCHHVVGCQAEYDNVASSVTSSPTTTTTTTTATATTTATTTATAANSSNTSTPASSPNYCDDDSPCVCCCGSANTNTLNNTMKHQRFSRLPEASVIQLQTNRVFGTTAPSTPTPTTETTTKNQEVTITKQATTNSRNANSTATQTTQSTGTYFLPLVSRSTAAQVQLGGKSQLDAEPTRTQMMLSSDQDIGGARDKCHVIVEIASLN